LTSPAVLHTQISSSYNRKDVDSDTMLMVVYAFWIKKLSVDVEAAGLLSEEIAI
jgi:hypothetical protein